MRAVPRSGRGKPFLYATLVLLLMAALLSVPLSSPAAGANLPDGVVATETGTPGYAAAARGGRRNRFPERLAFLGLASRFSRGRTA